MLLEGKDPEFNVDGAVVSTYYSKQSSTTDPPGNMKRLLSLRLCELLNVGEN